jgi:hypothetical protein
MSISGKGGGSMLLVEEYFSTGDDRFLSELRLVRSPQSLAGLADRWKRDPRDWARRQILDYLDLPLDLAGHQPLVKRLFKQAEADSNDEQMAAFMTAFDRLVRLRRRTHRHYDWQTRTFWDEEQIYAPRNAMPGKKTRKARNPRTGKLIEVPARMPREGLLFSYHTRRYLRRRAWRYFRRLGHRRPSDYVNAVSRALVPYRDDDLRRGEDILECWGLVHACFGRHSSLKFGASRVALREGATLAGLEAAPYFPELWQRPEAFDALFRLLTTARSRLVRVWATQLLKRDHAARLDDLPADDLLRMLEHEDAEVQQFGAGMLTNARGLAAWPIATWLRLTEVDNPTALALVCEAMARHVQSARLDLAQCLALATAAPTPVARLGLSFLRERRITTDDDRRALAAVADARSAAVGQELTKWALGIVGQNDVYDREIVTRLLDSLLAEVRLTSWQWLQSPDSLGYNDTVVWSRLLETPFDDVRLRLVDHLTHRANLPGVDRDDLAPLWCRVLLGVHRSGRQKAKAISQLAQSIAERPERAELLLPVLAVAVRSVRLPELRAGLSALVTAVEKRPELAPLIEKFLPEVKIMSGSPGSG